jgi:hypothetical protein
VAARKRRAKSTISRLPAEQREYIERLLRDGRMTLDEMIADLRNHFPDEPAAEISRSALNRYDNQFAEMTARMREIQTMADAVVGEMGEGIGEKSGELLSQAIITLATNAALQAHGQDDVPIETIRKLSVAAKNAMDSRRVDLTVRRAIREEARAQLLAEQAAKLDKVVKTGGLSEDAAADMRKKILGIG